MTKWTQYYRRATAQSLTGYTDALVALFRCLRLVYRTTRGNMGDTIFTGVRRLEKVPTQRASGACTPIR